MHRVFMRYLLLVMLALLGMVVFAGVSSFKGRWVVPLLCVLPLAAFAVRPELQRHARGGRYSAAIAVVAVAILIAAGARPWISGLRGDVDELNHPPCSWPTPCCARPGTTVPAPSSRRIT